MLTTWIPTMAVLLILACCFGVLIGRRVGIAEERERNRPVPNPYAGLQAAHADMVLGSKSRMGQMADLDHCPGTVTNVHEWAELPREGADYGDPRQRFKCAACGVEKVE